MKTIHQNTKIGIFQLAVVLSCFALIGTAGCQLDFPNPNAPIVENIPVQSLVTGAESGMRSDYAIYLRVVSSIGRETYYFEPADPRYTGELLRGVIDPGGFLLNRPWGGRYRVVANCNFLLDKAKALSAAERAGVEGFAKTIMAYQLLLNLNYLDENGLKLDFSGNPGVPFATKAQAFAYIETLLNEGNTSLGSAGSSFSFSLTSGFAGVKDVQVFNTPSGFAKFNRALRARVAVYQGKNSEVLTALQGSFLSTTAPMDLGVYYLYGTGLGDQNNEIFETPTAPFVKLMAHPSFETEAASGDTRFSSKVVVRSTATTFDNLTSRLAVAVTKSSTDRLPIIRNEELLLLRAEANVGLGNLAAAQTDINLVRAAAGLGPVALTSADALDRLLQEKRYSLFMEGHRWIDMRRYNRLAQLPKDRQGDAVPANLPRPETE